MADKNNIVRSQRSINKNKTSLLSDWQRLKTEDTLLTRGKEKGHEYCWGEPK